jgi:DNA-binding transcriptional LysR family regulator
MNVSKYKALLVAVDMGSFSVAASHLGYTQSGMTHMMNSLEEEIGFPVLQRGYFGVKLTPEGERIIPRIRALVNCEEALYNEIELVRSYGGNVLRIGAYSSMATHWIPEIIELFNKEYPEITVNVQTGTVAELTSGLESGRFDIVFGSYNPKYDFKWIRLAEDRFYAILPNDYPLESETEFKLSGFNGTKFLMPGLGFDEEISTVFSENNVKPNDTGMEINVVILKAPYIAFFCSSTSLSATARDKLGTSGIATALTKAGASPKSGKASVV